MIETTGYKLNVTDESRDPKNFSQKEHEILEELERKELEDAIPSKAQKKIENVQTILRQPFNFYTFGVELNSENRIDIINRQYNRLLESQIVETTV